ncbi:hypothetical protein K7A41_00170 [Sphingobacterium sp. InxBP1]|uniref:hypothetical protein n=1 Tax=Sphingobacterium sp. InxBP1 TaxID=2870328 RepID=UPI0022446DE9|nr:hypothetical protein [Sphingobacterium sp. InxBP1]MCW8309641.1 hypothetical protein [Sphingobacterium sp. InxBP1]
MTREQVLDYICLGYNVLENGRPISVLDTLAYLQEIDEEDSGVFVLEDLLTWDQKELDMIDGQKYYDEIGEYGMKLFIRNVAIRTGIWEGYEDFLVREFPETSARELQEARELAGRVIKMTKEEFRDWVAANDVNLIVSDLFVLDEGSILTGSVETTKALDGVLGDGLEDLIECHVSPMDVLNLTDHEIYWVDPVVKA